MQYILRLYPSVLTTFFIFFKKKFTVTSFTLFKHQFFLKKSLDVSPVRCYQLGTTRRRKRDGRNARVLFSAFFRTETMQNYAAASCRFTPICFSRRSFPGKRNRRRSRAERVRLWFPERHAPGAIFCLCWNKESLGGATSSCSYAISLYECARSPIRGWRKLRFVENLEKIEGDILEMFRKYARVKKISNYFERFFKVSYYMKRHLTHEFDMHSSP